MMRQTVEFQDGDRDAVEAFMENVKTTCGLVEEMLVTNPTYVLSPVLRDMLRDKARELDGMRLAIKAHTGGLAVDNLGKPLAEQFVESMKWQKEQRAKR